MILIFYRWWNTKNKYFRSSGWGLKTIKSVYRFCSFNLRYFINSNFKKVVNFFLAAKFYRSPPSNCNMWNMTGVYCSHWNVRTFSQLPRQTYAHFSCVKTSSFFPPARVKLRSQPLEKCKEGFLRRLIYLRLYEYILINIIQDSSW